MRRSQSAATNTSSVIDAVEFPSGVRFMRSNELALLQLHVPLRPGPRFFVPPISGKQIRALLIHNFAANFLALEMPMFRNKNRRLRRRPKSAESGPFRSSLDIRHSTFVISTPVERFHPENIRPMCFFEHGCADTIVPEKRGQTRQRFKQLLWIFKSSFK